MGDFPGSSMVKNLPAKEGDTGDMSLIPGLGRSLEEGNGNPPQFSCLENSMDREAWWATVHEVTKSRTRLSVTNKVKSKTVASEDSLIPISSQFLSSEAIAF